MPQMLEYENVSAKLTSVTPISEKHGNRRESAQSLIIELVLPNHRLAVFDEELITAFYRAPDGSEPEPNLDVDPDDLEGLTEKRFPWFRQDIEIERELAGYTLTIDFGLGGDQSNIELEAKKICDFRIGIRDHGLFALRHRFVVHPSTIEKGRIEEMLQQEIKVTLVAPRTGEQGELLEPPKKRGRGRPRKNLADPVAAAPEPAEEPPAPVETAPAKKAARKKALTSKSPTATFNESNPGAAWPFPDGVRP